MTETEMPAIPQDGQDEINARARAERERVIDAFCAELDPPIARAELTPVQTRRIMDSTDWRLAGERAEAAIRAERAAT